MSPVVSPHLSPPVGTTWTKRQSPAPLMGGHQGTGDKHGSVDRGRVPAAWRGSKERWGWCRQEGLAAA